MGLEMVLDGERGRESQLLGGQRGRLARLGKYRRNGIPGGLGNEPMMGENALDEGVEEAPNQLANGFSPGLTVLHEGFGGGRVAGEVNE